jgi:hypothetical protein
MAFLKVPFSKNDQLSSALAIASIDGQPRLVRQETQSSTLPGFPLIDLAAPDASDAIKSFLYEDLRTPDLNKLAPYLWLVSTPRSAHISQLHHQAALGRSIIIVENPQLHLVWYKDRIFIKPIPQYLLSSVFWEFYLGSPESPRDAALGFCRSYYHLIKHESDFRLAQKEGLVPADVSHERFSCFIKSFRSISDDNVAPRYKYGELRLSRLNFYSRIFLFPRLTFHHLNHQWADYIGAIFIPLFAVFAVLSILLDSMQVALASLPISENGAASSWNKLPSAARGFAATMMVFALLIFVLIGSLVVFFFVHDNWFARRELKLSRKGGSSQDTWNRRKSAVV